MFNGIIYNTGIIKNISKSTNSLEISLKTRLAFKKSEIGNSLNCNGTCLTITSVSKDLISFYLYKETIKKTNFKYIKKGDTLNIERSLSYGNKISGHYVQGHIDTTAKISNIRIIDKTWVISFIVNRTYSKYLIEKGSISVNGVSLTISKIKKNRFEVNIIPHTLKLTNLIKLKKDNYVNIEFDIFSKYLIKLKK